MERKKHVLHKNHEIFNIKVRKLDLITYQISTFQCCVFHEWL